MKQYGGWIGHYHLEDWWENELTDDERNTLEVNYTQFSGSISSDGTISSGLKYGTLTSGNITSSSRRNKFAFVSGLIGVGDDCELAKKIIKYADSLINSKTKIEDIHFYYLSQIRFFYRNRDKAPDALDLAIEACEKQIAISKEAVVWFKEQVRKHGNGSADPDSEVGAEHTGYKQLCIIRNNQGRYEDVIQLATAAKEEGWVGNWDNRIAKAKKKLGIT